MSKSEDLSTGYEEVEVLGSGRVELMTKGGKIVDALGDGASLEDLDGFYRLSIPKLGTVGIRPAQNYEAEKAMLFRNGKFSEASLFEIVVNSMNPVNVVDDSSLRLIRYLILTSMEVEKVEVFECELKKGVDIFRKTKTDNSLLLFDTSGQFFFEIQNETVDGKSWSQLRDLLILTPVLED